MTYKETLFFVGKCLTITHETKNKEIIEKELKLGNVDWDNVVKLSTSHYVFPALYCNLKRANFLHYLPNDLVEYMKHITDLNRERNRQIIAQAKEINDLLLANNITPIFLKGTGNLLEGLYEDIAERMVGDIDFLINKEHCQLAFQILKKNGYNNTMSESFEDHRHLPRITNPKKIAAIEIHKEILRHEKSSFFNYQKVKNSLITINNISFLSFKNQIKLTIYSKLINDYGYLLKNINIRAAYDYFLLGHKLSINTQIHDKYLSKELEAGLNLYSFVLSKPERIIFSSTPQSELFKMKVIKNLGNNKIVRFNRKLITFYLKLIKRIKIIFKAFYLKSYYNFIISRITSINWYKRKLGLRN
ncbi:MULTISPECIES: nucleotidyltransferase family protein [unclassified Tenacibaculum]|uniref:nucleotidyltransferase family protein n=1 Tax=unclassified Tenacibaculum TaxID=2635139 RepID=UPI001F18486B|nr:MULTISPECIES: nucleotidyltransferase family protein [unclassified Tenacibaculum]MCF2873317.1 nucleotidyltransferase family protein [Tenacibaculum sp. Cn5-1]MCF2933473.1 nucleotidyltransferase family protein [Tenacibaculum sp. Cn5-34]MCG7509945.1 nucleotidyltransferase family protein [Tenacibaculum sp. Cn5-46]